MKLLCFKRKRVEEYTKTRLSQDNVLVIRARRINPERPADDMLFRNA